jgi:hypothetical protein
MAVDACGVRPYGLIAKPHKVARPELPPSATERLMCAEAPCHAERDPAI